MSRRPKARSPGFASPPAKRGGSSTRSSRKWVYRALAVVLVPAVMFGLVEVALRLAGYGYSPDFFRRLTIDGQPMWVENDKFGLRFFPPSLARSPAPTAMAVAKPAGTYRIFLFGESAALGDPRPAYGMGRYLKVLLQERFPDLEFEVVGVAMTAINSHALLPMARECVRHQGDLWIVYMGNNEWVGPFGAATIFGPHAPSLGLIRLSLALKSTRTGQLLDALLQRWASKSPPAGPWGGMGMFLEKTVAPDAPRRLAAYDWFQANLEGILRQARRADCPVILSTVASNLRDCAPFASAHASQRQPPAASGDWDALYQAGVTSAEKADWPAALAAYMKAEAIDPQYAELQYRIGQARLALGQPAQARTAFEQARDCDALPFRADSRLNALIRRTAERYRDQRVELFDAEERFRADAPGGVPGAESFLEHVHFTFAGNYRIARGLAELVVPHLPAARIGRQAPAWASEETCERRLGLTDWNRAAILEQVLQRIQGPPFAHQLNHAQQRQYWQAQWNEAKARLTSGRAEEAMAVYQEAVARFPHDHQLREGYAEFLESVGRIDQAIGVWKAVSRLIPHHFAAYVHAGRLLGRQRQWAEAEASLRKAVGLEPRSAEAHLELGRVLAGQNQVEAALREYALALRWQPGNSRIYLAWADLLARQEKRAEAMEMLARAVQVQPSSWEARYLLGVELAMTNRVAEAQREFEAVVRLRPDYVLAHLNLGVAFAVQGNVAEARREFEETLRLDPQNQKAQQHLRALDALTRIPSSGPDRR